MAASPAQLQRSDSSVSINGIMLDPQPRRKDCGCFLSSPEKKTCLSKKYHMIWYVYFSILVFEPHHKLGYAEGDGC